MINFVILNCEIDNKVLIILGKPLLDTGRNLVDVECGKLKFTINGDEVSLNLCKSMNQLRDMQVISAIDLIDYEVTKSSKVGFISEPLAKILWNYGSEDISLIGFGSYSKNFHKIDLDLKNNESPPTKLSIEDYPNLELKPLSPHL